MSTTNGPNNDEIIDDLKNLVGWEPDETLSGDGDSPGIFDSELAGWLEEGSTLNELEKLERIVMGRKAR